VRRLAVIVTVVGLLACAVRAEPRVTVTIDANAPGVAIPPDFVGLSFETANVSPDRDGKYLFEPGNASLVALFKTIGIRSLRIGGNMADRPGVPIPGPGDIDRLFAFAKAADVSVIYTLRLRDGDPQKDAEIAKYISDHYASQLACYAIGNEPNFYIDDYAEYRKQWTAISSAVLAVAPAAKFCGPSALDKSGWASEFLHDFGKSDFLAYISQHAYFGGTAKRFKHAEAARDAMLSPKWLGMYETFYDDFAKEAVASGVRYRLEETNNFSEGGVDGASNTFAAALWALDYLHWWAAHGAAGVNFHNRRWILNCVIYPTTQATGEAIERREFDVRPIAYGIKAFDLGGHGEVVPVTIENPQRINLTAYAVRDRERLFLTIINKEHGPDARRAMVALGSHQFDASAEFGALAAPDGMTTAIDGVSLGGEVFGKDGSWKERWVPVAKHEAHECAIELPPASAVVIRSK
jgi:hypothetical protein